ncbi:hypothetical protein V512_011680 [Mesotoga sp. Brook.08.105.5.1]|nr:hypothetical protein V512_011680 [Mesotoga sp. Brook.08.105.5.1]RAM58162.1 hypothetical protein DS65_00255 [Mesotoga sp. SC_4PWL113PWK15]
MLPACFYTICSSIYLEVKEQQEQHFHPICSIYLQYPCWVTVLFGAPVQSHFGPDPGSRGLEPPAESVIISCCSYSLLTAYSVFCPSGFFAREAELAFAKQRLASESSR